jgi:hypothetical protein
VSRAQTQTGPEFQCSSPVKRGASSESRERSLPAKQMRQPADSSGPDTNARTLRAGATVKGTPAEDKGVCCQKKCLYERCSRPEKVPCRARRSVPAVLPVMQRRT